MENHSVQTTPTLLVKIAEAEVGVRGHFRRNRNQGAVLDTGLDMARMRGAYDAETEKGACAETI